MDFSFFANERYVRLVRSFDSITHVLHIHLLELARIGFDMKEGYLFGFSFGGRLVCEAARRLGIRIIKEIDGQYATFHTIHTMSILFCDSFLKKKFATWPDHRSIFEDQLISNCQHRMCNAFIRIVVTKVLAILHVIKIGDSEIVELLKVISKRIWCSFEVKLVK